MEKDHEDGNGTAWCGYVDLKELKPDWKGSLHLVYGPNVWGVLILGATSLNGS